MPTGIVCVQQIMFYGKLRIKVIRISNLHTWWLCVSLSIKDVDKTRLKEMCDFSPENHRHWH